MQPSLETWLNRRDKPKKVRKPLRRTRLLRGSTPVKRVSKRHAKELRTYFKLRREYLDKNAACEAGPVILNAKLPEFYHVPRCEVWAVEVHHTKRRGPNLNNVESFCGACSVCHQWIHAHAQKSRELGLLDK